MDDGGSHHFIEFLPSPQVTLFTVPRLRSHCRLQVSESRLRMLVHLPKHPDVYVSLLNASSQWPHGLLLSTTSLRTRRRRNSGLLSQPPPKIVDGSMVITDESGVRLVLVTSDGSNPTALRLRRALGLRWGSAKARNSQTVTFTVRKCCRVKLESPSATPLLHL